MVQRVRRQITRQVKLNGVRRIPPTVAKCVVVLSGRTLMDSKQGQYSTSMDFLISQGLTFDVFNFSRTNTAALYSRGSHNDSLMVGH
jgi:hypothetical protein